MLTFNAAGTPAVKTPDADTAVTDNLGAICWQKNAVTRALGEVNFFERLDDPQYYGDLYSALVRMSGRARRTDNLGIVAIVQGTVS